MVRGEWAQRDRIVVGIDGSPQSHLALVTAFGEAARRQAPLLVVHAWAMPLRTQGGDRDYGSELTRGEREGRLLAEREASRASAGFPDVVYEVTVGDRSAGAELVDATHDAQLVVVGSRGVGALRGLLLGSTAHALLHHAACPVLVVRD